jgi:hypothetical protein
LFTLLEVEHEQGVGHAIGPYVPVCVKAVAGRAGLSSDTTSKVVSRLAQFGAWKNHQQRNVDRFRMKTLASGLHRWCSPQPAKRYSTISA